MPGARAFANRAIRKGYVFHLSPHLMVKNCRKCMRKYLVEHKDILWLMFVITHILKHYLKLFFLRNYILVFHLRPQVTC